MNRFISLCIGLLLCAQANAAAFFYTVTGTTDNTDSATHGGSGTAGSPFQMSSLRGATIAANSNPGSTIILPAGIYTLTIPGDVSDRQFLSFNPLIGDLNVNASGITIRGAGPGSTVITQATGADRIIVDNATSAANFTFTLSGVTITGGRETETGSNIGGAAIFVGGPTNTTVFTNCIFVNNRINPSGTQGSLGGGALINTGGNCLIVNCTFGGFGATDPNISISSGGAISYDSSDFIHNGLIGTLTVSNCTFIGNVATNHGGAITIADSNLSSATANITRCTFIGNRAGNAGGAIVAQSGTLNVTACTFLTNFAQVVGGAIYGSGIPNTVHYSRFIANTAGNPANGNTISAQTASLNATDNWWGRTTGPDANDARNSTTTTWLQLRHSANPGTIFIPTPTTLTATFLTNSAGTFIPVSNLSQLLGLPIAFNNPIRGTLSGAQATIQPAGTATATFTPTYAGAGSAGAVVDSATATASITIPTAVGSINRVQTSPTNLPSVQWTVTLTNPVTGVASGNFSLVNSGLGGTPSITSVGPVGGTPATSWTVTASTGSGTGTLGLNMVNGTGVATILNLPFNGQAYTIDLVRPDTSVTVQPPAITNSASASFSFTGSDVGVGVAGFQCRLDGAAYTNCTSPVVFTGLPDGLHTFNVRAVDGAGNVDSTPGIVAWSVDTTPPTILCPKDLIVNADAGTCSKTNVTLGLPTTFDAGGVASVTNNGLASYPVGTSIITWIVKDLVGFSNTCNQLVMIRDTQAPSITCPSNITVTAAGNCPVPVDFVVGATDNCGLTNLVVTPGTGSFFPVGTNIVNAVAQDASGNSNTCSFIVTVLAGAQPQLSIVKGGTNVIMSWPDAFYCYNLQSTPTLLAPPASIVWTVLPGPFVRTGGTFFATNNLADSNRFFRLAY